MAGSGLRVRECSESIMQCDRLSARKAVKVARLSGTWLKRFEDKSREKRVLDRGAKLVEGIDVMALSAKLKCLRKRHLEAGKIPMERRLPPLDLEWWWCHDSDKLE
jgi:hypothetical protein